MTKDDLYLLVEGEPYLSACRDWWERFKTARAVAFAYARAQGANGIFPDIFTENLRAITVSESPPPGWRRAKRGRQCDADRLIPGNGPAGMRVRAEIAALPSHPSRSEIARLIGVPLTLSYKTPRGCHSEGLGHPLRPVDLGILGDDIYIIRAPNVEAAIQEVLKQEPNATLMSPRWEPPAGLRPISKARYELLLAEARVRGEEEGARK